jgi:glycerol-3-phosphate cytidylyltransferase
MLMRRQLRLDTTFKGDDWPGSERRDKLEKQFAEVGVHVVYFPA